MADPARRLRNQSQAGEGVELMKRLATRVYTFQELMNRIDMEFWSVHHHGQEQYTFVPVRYKGK
jgi:hypothetical protein